MKRKKRVLLSKYLNLITQMDQKMHKKTESCILDQQSLKWMGKTILWAVRKSHIFNIKQ